MEQVPLTAIPQQYTAGKPYKLFKAKPDADNDWYGIYDHNNVNRLTFPEKPGAVFCVGFERAQQIENEFNAL